MVEKQGVNEDQEIISKTDDEGQAHPSDPQECTLAQ